MTQHSFHSGLRSIGVTGSTRLDLEVDLFLRWNITSLTVLNLSRNHITKIWQGAFYSLAYLQNLDLSGNSITSLDSQTFHNNAGLVRLSLEKNSITDIDPSTFQNNFNLKYINVSFNKITSLDPDLFKNNVDLKGVRLMHNKISYIHPLTFQNNRELKELYLSGNKINSINPETFKGNWEIQYLNLSSNSIPDVHPLTFRNNDRLGQLDISRNKITVIKEDTFIHNRELTFLYLQGNNITEISNTSFRGLEQLEELDLSNNHIEELNPLVFHNTLKRTNGQNHQASKLKRIHLDQNMIRSFNFELYFPMNSNSDSSNPTFQLQYLNLSSNRLTTLDVASMKWLNQTTTLTDLTANPWNCDCSVLLEVWRGLKHKHTLHCASPSQLQGKSWDVAEVFCSLDGGSSVVTTTLIMTGVLLVCALGWGLILARVVKRQRNKPKTHEYCVVYAPRAHHNTLHLYAEIAAVSSNVTDQSYADVGIRPTYITVLS
jgi:Leucine-rich repeat (LRR) protein